MILPRNFWILTHLRIWEVSQILQIFQNFCFPFGKRFFESLRLPLAKGSSTSHPDPLSSGAREKTALLGARTATL